MFQICHSEAFDEKGLVWPKSLHMNTVNASVDLELASGE